MCVVVLGTGLGGSQLVISVDARAKERTSLRCLVEEGLVDVVLRGMGRQTAGAKASVCGWVLLPGLKPRPTSGARAATAL